MLLNDPLMKSKAILNLLARFTVIPSHLIPMKHIPLLFAILFAACNTSSQKVQITSAPVQDMSEDSLPAPSRSRVNFSKVIGWPEGKTPVAPAGFTVSQFAGGLDNPRWIYVADNGDIFIVESSKGRIQMFRDSNKDGVAEKTFAFAEKLNDPLGMLVLNNHFYIANTDGLWMFDYAAGDTTLRGEGKKIVSLPAGGYNNHWTRNIVANKDGSKIYVSVGSGSNVAEHGMDNEVRRANILEINPDGSGERIFASGLRNPVGMDWAPGTNTLWTAVNERDKLGDDLVPDYITSVKDGGFYGWPYSYFGQHVDERMKDDPHPELVQKAIVPDVSMGAHTASLGLAFYEKKMFPEHYQNGAFVGQHGSWNRSELSGYKVVFVPFENGTPGKPEDFLTGFIADAAKSEVYGRPVGVAVLADGSLLVADDAGGVIWRVSKK